MSTYISTAITPGRVSAISGFNQEALQKEVLAGFIPQGIAIVGQKETAFEGVTDKKLTVTTASEIGKKFGFKSELYSMARILLPKTGGQLSGIRVTAYPVAEPATTPTSKQISCTVLGTATATKTHSAVLNGRASLDDIPFSFTVIKDDTATVVAGKIRDAINNVFGVPGTATAATTVMTFESGWKGASADEMSLSINIDGDAVGMTYTIAEVQPGAGVVALGSTLPEFGTVWETMVVCPYNDATSLSALEAFNGTPQNADGRYLASAFLPFVAYFGDNTVNTLAGSVAYTDTPSGRKEKCTLQFSPCPNSPGLSGEAAANWCYKYAPLAQGIPHKDPEWTSLSDMPTADSIGDYSDPDKRDQIVKAGGSTCILKSGQYEIVDAVTTYHPEDESQTSMVYRWTRDIVGSYFNYRYSYMIYENIFVKGNTIVGDNYKGNLKNTISPLRWSGILKNTMGPDLEMNALIQSAEDFAESVQVQQSSVNKNRFETTFETESTGVVRIASTTNNIIV